MYPFNDKEKKNIFKTIDKVIDFPIFINFPHWQLRTLYKTQRDDNQII